MSKKWGAALLLQVILLVFGVVNACAQEERTSLSRVLQLAGSYEAKVAEVRSEFAAERERLGLSSDQEDRDPTPELHLGDEGCKNMAGGGGSGGNGGSGGPGSGGPSNAGSEGCASSSKGSPVWRVNMVNLNLFMEDTPLWYKPPIGPAVEIKLSYNSGSPYVSLFFYTGWSLNYGSYLTNYNWPPQAMGQAIIIIMPDGRADLYYPDGAGGYTSPNKVFTKLTKIAEKHFELRFRDDTVYVYNVSPGGNPILSRLVEIRDPHGQKLTFGYDTDYLTTITDATGKITTLSYDADGYLTQVTDPFGRSASFQYNAYAELSRITDMGGYRADFTYDSRGYLSSLTNPDGNTWSFYVEPADGIYPSSSYPAPGSPMGTKSRITVTNPSGSKEEYYNFKGTSQPGVNLYASGWYVSPKNYVPYTGPASNNQAITVPKALYVRGWREYSDSLRFSVYDTSNVITPEGKTLAAVTYDPKGNATRLHNSAMADMNLTYNSMGSVTSLSGWEYPPTSMTYASNGVDVTGITDGLGTVALTYNATHDITSVTDRSGHTTLMTYNGYGQLTSSTDPLGIKTNYVYDSNHFLTQVTRSGQTLESYSYDTKGRVETYTDAKGITRTYDYNNLDDLIKITYPDAKYDIITYSGSIPRLVTAITDRSGKATDYSYNSSNKLTQILNPEGGITRYGYDANGKITKLTDPNGNATSFEYNNDNMLVKKAFADGTFTSFSYDAINRISKVTNARGDSVTYGRDGKGNLTSLGYSDFSYETPSVSHTYDIYNRLIETYHGYGGAGTYKYTYNADSLLTSIDGPLTNDTLTLQYDAKDRMTGYTLQGGQSVSYTYDAFNRVTAINNSAGTFSYTYPGASPVVQKLTRPNGSYTEYGYDTLKRLTSLSNKTSTGSIINKYTHTYNAQDLRASETVTNGAQITSFVAGWRASTYDNVNELLSSTNPNRTYVYDEDGNLIQGEYTTGGYAYTAGYTTQNRLAAVQYRDSSKVDHKIEYVYNSNGFLARKKKGTTTVNYVLTGLLPLQERDGSNSLTREYTWGLDYGGGIGGLLALKQGGQNFFYLYDGKGNVTAVIDSSQKVVATYAYDPFGKVMTKTGTLDQPYQFSTKPYDADTGLSNYGYRFYSPDMGRWITRDPIGEEGGINLYEFAESDPVNHSDPFGMEGGLVGFIEINIERQKLLAGTKWNQPSQAEPACEVAKNNEFSEQAREQAAEVISEDLLGKFIGSAIGFAGVANVKALAALNSTRSNLSKLGDIMKQLADKNRCSDCDKGNGPSAKPRRVIKLKPIFINIKSK